MSQHEKLKHILLHIEQLLFMLPLGGDDVRRFLKTMTCTPFRHEQIWNISPSVASVDPYTFYVNLNMYRGFENQEFDPFYMIHDIKAAYHDKDIDKTVRKISSYLETFMFVYEHHMKSQSKETVGRKGTTEPLREEPIVDDGEEYESGDDFQTEDLDRIGTPRDAKLLCNLLSQLQNI